MVEINIRTDIEALERDLTRLQAQQVPFVAAVTLTRLAQESQARIRAELPSNFTIRSGNRLPAGVRIQTARKADFQRGTIHSRVFDVDEFLTIHTTGGDKKPGLSKSLAIPDPDFVKNARTSSGAIRKTQKPAAQFMKIKTALSKRKGGKRGRKRRPLPFIIQKRNGQIAIAKREGPERYPLEFLYGFHGKAKIDKRWPFIKTVEDIINTRLAQIWRQELTRAL